MFLSVPVLLRLLSVIMLVINAYFSVGFSKKIMVVV